MLNKKLWKAQGSYVSQNGVKMILEMDENGATVLSPVVKTKTNRLNFLAGIFSKK